MISNPPGRLAGLGRLAECKQKKVHRKKSFSCNAPHFLP